MSETIRIVKTCHYTQIHNSLLEDNTISWQAKGLLAYLLSRKSGWTISSRHLATVSKGGIDQVQRTLRELQTARYIHREQLRDERGRLGDWVSWIYESPDANDRVSPELSDVTENGKTDRGKPDRSKTDRGKPDRINTNQSKTEVLKTELLTHTDPERVCEKFEPEEILPDPEPSQAPITLPAATESTSTSHPSSEEDLPPSITKKVQLANIPDRDLSAVARFDRTLRTYQPAEDLTAQLVETYNRIKPEHWGKCSQIGAHMPRQVAGLIRRYDSPELVIQEWGEAILALKINDFYNSPKFQSGNINFLLDPTKPDRIPQLAQAWRDRPQQQKEQLAQKMVAAVNGIPRWENPDVMLTGAMLSIRRDRYRRYVATQAYDRHDCPSIDYLQTYFPELFENG
jgi:hypothetical protein